MVKVLDSSLKVCEFKHKSCYFVHFLMNTLGEGIKSPLSHPAMG